MSNQESRAFFGVKLNTFLVWQPVRKKSKRGG
jgi:hypothetical protein